MSPTNAQPLWTLDELAARVALALAEGYSGQSSGRVSEIPNSRTLRYYTTLGLLDRPSEMRGRTALYGPRHLAQIVAIKRLQAEGLGLAEVQERLAGLTDGALRKIAQVAPAALEPAPAPAQAAQAAPVAESAPTAPARRAGAFWRDRPVSVSGPGGAQTEPPASAFQPEPAPMLALQGFPLEAGVTLLLAPERPLDVQDLEALREAAAPLLKLLETRGLTKPASK